MNGRDKKRRQITADFVRRVQGQLIVSCQALSDEPLFGAEIMARMALAARQGGAKAIRANGPDDIRAFRLRFAVTCAIHPVENWTISHALGS